MQIFIYMNHTILRKIISEIFSETFKPEVMTATKTNNDVIFYDFSKGKNFAYDMLQDKITNLDRYNLSDYIPISETAEKWMFETQSITDKTLLVEIKHKIKEEKSVWYFIFATMDRGETMPVIEYSSGAIENYDNLISTINSKAFALIDPNKE